jgi:hypothetical protein
MKRVALLLGILCTATSVFAGFKVKNIKPKKPEQFSARATSAGITFAADLLVEDKEQKKFFHKELIPSNIIAVRLAVFNDSKDEVVLPLEDLVLSGPDGKEIPMVDADTVSQAILQGLVVSTEVREGASPVTVAPSMRSGDPRMDPSDPRYDPRMDPGDPSYDPRMDPGDPNDPRNRRSGNRGPYMRPGVDVILNPGGGSGGGDLTQFEKQLVEKDFRDKEHPAEPLISSMKRDRFIYFSISDKPGSSKGFILRLPPSKGIPQEIVLKF